MKLLLSKDVKGFNRKTNETRLHAKAGDVLFVLLRRMDGSYICDSMYYPGEEIIVFRTQVKEIITDDLPDEQEQTELDEFYMSGDFDPGDIGEIEE